MTELYEKLESSEFYYTLPDDKIAKYPLERRDMSKLLHYKDGEFADRTFWELSSILPSGSFLVFNNTKVVHARLEMFKDSGARIEIFCLEPLHPYEYSNALSAKNRSIWKCLIGNAKKWKDGVLIARISIEGVEIAFEAKRLSADEVEFCWNGTVSFGQILDSFGELPIPPYLNRKTELIDENRYQTIYSKFEGSVAAPTAGLHFTEAITEELKQQGVKMGEVTLHVGAGTFKPLSEGLIKNHTMHTERFTVTCEFLKQMKGRLGNITAVGTTSMRTLESLYYIGANILNGKSKMIVSQWQAYESELKYKPEQCIDAIIEHCHTNKLQNLNAATQIMIVPGYKFQIVNSLITNFHQPHSTLLLLVSAFVGDKWKDIYKFALENGYRFLSYGDSSFLQP